MNASEASKTRKRPLVAQPAGTDKEKCPSLPDPSEGMRLIEDFWSIRDANVRAEIVQMVSKLARAQMVETC